ncbi:MAG: hypothetical protein HY293_14165 [Planctomycetes bacterium]|nr:hypothetical protein [Planctomycetota bacterium]
MNPREEQEEERVDRRLKALDREVQRLIDAYQAEIIELGELESRRKQAEVHRGVLEQRRRDRGSIRIESVDSGCWRGSGVFCERVRGSLHDPPFEVKQSVLRLVAERVVVEESRLVIHHVVPTEKFRLIPEWWAPRDSNP